MRLSPITLLVLLFWVAVITGIVFLIRLAIRAQRRRREERTEELELLRRLAQKEDRSGGQS